jgi:PLP dependent protein
LSYQDVLEATERAAVGVGRDPSTVTLVAVSKTKSVSEILLVYDEGHRDFGENRAQEMAEKAAQLPTDIRWHFVGGLQSNKARLIRPVTHLLHSIDRLSLADAWLKGPGLPPPVLLQVNIGRELQKSGVMPEDAAGVLESLLEQGLRVDGLMAIPPVVEDPEGQRPHFRALRRIRDDLATPQTPLSSLSMGMTDDFEIAIEEGATMIRVGRAIFGSRTDRSH